MSRVVSAVILGGLLLGGCSSPPVRQTLPPAYPDAAPAQARVEALYRQHSQWRGTPYRLGGNSREGIDCSAFVQQTYAALFDHRLPRTTADQQRVGRSVAPQQLLPGDLVFFRTSQKVRHVGVYVDAGRFLHASTSRGVMLSDLDNPYWQRHYVQARRVLE